MKVSEFLVQVFGSSSSKESFQQLKEWQSEGQVNSNLLQGMLDLHQDTDQLKGYKSFDVETALASTMEIVGQETNSASTKNYTRYIVAAIMAIILLIVSYFIWDGLSSKTKTFQASITPVVEQFEDGTAITLNQDASLVYDQKNNTMSLDGEAYFDIAPQKERMLVKTGHGLITVLGTSFNVNTSAELTEIFMHSGSISFQNKGDNSIVTLSKGEGLRLTDKVEKFNHSHGQLINYWNDHELKYENEKLSKILEDLQELFHKDFNDAISKAGKITITANFKDSTLDEILTELEAISGISIK